MMNIPELCAITIHALTDSIGLIGNALLIYVAVCKTPKNIRTYSILIINFGITDFFCSLTAMFVEQRLIPARLSLVIISSGPCKFIGPTVCFIGHSAMMHFYSHSLWSLFISFLYRYYVLRYHAPSVRTLIFAIVAFYSISFFQFISFAQAADSPEELTKIVSTHFPDYDTQNKTISGVSSVLKWNALFCILHMTLPVTPVYLVIIYVRSSIIRTLKGQTLSEPTKAIHSQLLKALTFQALLPGLYFFAVVTYVVGQLGIYNHPFLEYATFIIGGFVPCMSPIGSLYFIRPYNRWIRSLFFKRKSQIQDNTKSIPSTANPSIRG